MGGSSTPMSGMQTPSGMATPSGMQTPSGMMTPSGMSTPSRAGGGTGLHDTAYAKNNALALKLQSMESKVLYTLNAYRDHS